MKLITNEYATKFAKCEQRALEVQDYKRSPGFCCTGATVLGTFLETLQNKEWQ
jgi:hypothetical protein